jgi:hypothetical protein
MNLKEGTRRLAILLGAIGAIVGGVVAYVGLGAFLSQRASHIRFEQLANSKVVRQEQKTLRVAPKFIPDSAVTPDPSSAGHMRVNPDYWQEQSDVNQGGIRTIYWKKGYDVDSIETADGQYLVPTPAPAWWMYLIAALPIAGFFLPWVAVRAFGWMIAGFFQPSK